MSLTTAFPFQAYVGDLKTRKMMGHKSGVSLSLLTSEDIARMATVEVRTRCGQEERVAPWLPIRRRGELLATFYDTRMGNFDVRTFPTQSCTTCSSAQTASFGNERCQGHFGYVAMPRRYPGDDSRPERLFVINPHVADEVEQLLQAECFFCHRLRVPQFDVERYLQALRLVDAGLMGEALHFLDVVSNARGQEARNRRRRDPNETIISTVEMLREHVDGVLEERGPRVNAEVHSIEVNREVDHTMDDEDKAAQFRKPATDIRNHICKQAMSEFKDFVNVCSHCQGIAPRITTKHGHLFFYFSKKNGDFNVAHQLLTQAQLREWEESNLRHGRSRTYFQTAQVRDHLKQLCQLEAPILAALFPHIGESTVKMPFACPLPPNLLYKVFFLDKILVPPLALRLSSGVQVSKTGAISPDDQTRAISDVLAFVEQIETYYTLRNSSTPERPLVSTAQEIAHEHNLRNLQGKVMEVYASILDSFAKKEGLFRMHMMGKRVNQACRSVISPDYLVEPNEVLLPRPFARSLTYPEQVSNYAPARMELLKRCVMNGPKVYPGASHLEMRLPSGETRFVDLDVPEQNRRQHAIKYFATAQSGTLIVHRHVLDGDRLIFNRQPTLHKASMMGYRAKVLSGLKTLRFHYVNGKSYNADFDGDEMNIHVPQSIEAKAELECLMDANLNYLVPTSGKPIRGLIQDHIVAGVLLTLRDRMMPHDTFVQYVFNGVAPYMRHQGNTTTLTELIPMPAILKPRPRWTGKQLISVLVHYVTGLVTKRTGIRPKNAGVSVTGTSLVQPSAYTTTNLQGDIVQISRKGMDDDRVLFMNSELITGVLCKNQLGPANLSLPHVIYETYGPHMVGELFGALGRVLTLSLQREGFSMGMDDMCLLQEERRTALLRELDNAPLSLPADEAKVMPVIMGLATQLQKEFVPGRMLVPFPYNQLLMMTMSGAKGSNTNTIQMALGLGQQLFDGRRVRRMNSGKTMPAFFAGETRARSLGYAIGRFASGIRPAEYTIHAMAGRDGLIDTAVKTSRSGHLQRCLIKGLESLVVHWDHSVRDSNGSVVQFLYGGDGLDPMKSSSLQAWEMVKDNVADLGRKFGVDTGEQEAETEERQANGKRGRGDEALELRRAQQQVLVDAEVSRDPLPGHIQKNLQQYLQTKATYPLFKKVSQVARWNRQGTTIQKLGERRQENVEYFAQVVGEVTAHRRVRAYCDAGEPVGLLAAQAAGEPSTQMTLNTFHSAGSTVTHVTEGIPRLRELLIYASVKKAAVIVPVEKATEADEQAISTILGAATLSKLTDCLATGGSSRGYHFHVDRGAEGCHLTIALLFSKKVLVAKQRALCMSPSEHLDSFVSVLRALAKSVVGALDGRQERVASSGSGLVNVSVQDPAMLEAAAVAAAELEEDAVRARDDEDEDRSTLQGTPAPGVANAPGDRPSMKRLRLLDSGSEEDDRSATSDDEDETAVKSKAAKVVAENSDGEVDAAEDLFMSGPSNTAETYDTFAPIQTAYRNKKYLVSIMPLTAASAARQGVAAFPDDLFLVNVGIRCPSDVVAVMPDVLERCLRQQTFPTWLPQFESATYTRKAEDPTSGELVFQGERASIRSVTSFLSLFTLRARAIKVRRARSTDIQDMRLSLGVESCYRVLYDELDKLFRRYAVDYHHLTLIADAATHRGMWESFNFTGVISHSASPLFQMTFASSKRFLHAALTRGIGDELNSLSSAIMVGERPKVGTACVKVTQDPSVLRDVVERTFA